MRKLSGSSIALVCAMAFSFIVGLKKGFDKFQVITLICSAIALLIDVIEPSADVETDE
jgi:hypothetical protein